MLLIGASIRQSKNRGPNGGMDTSQKTPSEIPTEESSLKSLEAAEAAGEACGSAIEKNSRWFVFQGVRYHFLQWKKLNTQGEAEYSSPAKPLILLHGFSQSAESWEKVATSLVHKSTVYALDLVGHGKSDRPQEVLPYTLAAQGSALLAFSNMIQQNAPACEKDVEREASEQAAGDALSKKPRVVGYSMGGRVALVAAQQDSQAFGSLVLESVGIGPETSEERRVAAERDAACAARLREQGIEAFMNFWEQLRLFDTQRALPEKVQQNIPLTRLNNSAEALARSFEYAGQHVMPDRELVVSTLDYLRCNCTSVKYVAGALDEKYQALAKKLAEENLAETHIVRSAGHNVHVEKPMEFVQILR